MFYSDVKWQSIDRIRNVKLRTLFLHGNDDKMVPVSMAKDLQSKVAESKLVIVPGVGHNQLWKHESYYKSI